MWLYQPLEAASAELLAGPVAYPGYVKIYMGATLGWVYKPVKEWNGTAWVIKPVKWYDSSTSTWKTTSGL